MLTSIETGEMGDFLEDKLWKHTKQEHLSLYMYTFDTGYCVVEYVLRCVTVSKKVYEATLTTALLLSIFKCMDAIKK